MCIQLFSPLHVQLAAELGACAVSHLECVSEAGIKAMAGAGVVGVLLPTTAYILRLKPPPAREMMDAGEREPIFCIALCRGLVSSTCSVHVHCITVLFIFANCTNSYIKFLRANNLTRE